MSTPLHTLSQQLADTVDGLSSSLVSVTAGRRRLTGVAWSDDLVVTTLHPLRRGRRGPGRHRRGRHRGRHGHHDPGCRHHGYPETEEERRAIAVSVGGQPPVEAELVGHDRSTDLLLLRVPGGGLTPAPWADTDGVRVGHLALVVGRPGASVRATLGMVSGVGRAFRTPMGGQLDRLLHVDATLPPGCIGGVLATPSGEVLGVNTDGIVQGGTTIPTETLRRVVGQLLAHGSVQRGFLGVGVQAARLPVEAAGVSGQDHGLVVVAVEADSPASAAGLTVGDVLLRIDGAPLEHLDGLILALQEDRAGAAAALDVLRGGQVVVVPVTLGVRSAEE